MKRKSVQKFSRMQCSGEMLVYAGLRDQLTCVQAYHPIHKHTTETGSTLSFWQKINYVSDGHNISVLHSFVALLCFLVTFTLMFHYFLF